MRTILSLLSLLVVVAIVSGLAKKQLGTMSASPTPAAPSGVEVQLPVGTPKEQVQQVQQAIEAAVQARPMPDDIK